MSATNEPTDVAEKAKPRHPVIELLARYKAIFSAAWADRAELAGPTRLADETAFLPAALSLQDTPVHPAPRRLAYVGASVSPSANPPFTPPRAGWPMR